MNVCLCIYIYLHVSAAPGGTSLNVGGFVPYPGYSYFLNDLWFFNLATGLWTELVFPVNAALPQSRTGMVFLLLGDVIFLHGEGREGGLIDGESIERKKMKKNKTKKRKR